MPGAPAYFEVPFSAGCIGEPNLRVQAHPDVLVVCVIPYAPHMLVGTSPSYRTPPWRIPAYALVLLSGNPPPDNSYASVEDARDTLMRTREFRAALWFRDVRAWLDSQDRLVGIEGWRGVQVGYTPFRLGRASLGLFMKGKDEAYPGERLHRRVEPDGSAATVTHGHRFKLGPVADAVNYALTFGHRAPWAHAGLVYAVYPHGGYLEVAGSVLPSLHLYASATGTGLARVGHAACELASAQQVNRFIVAGMCKEAPTVPRAAWDWGVGPADVGGAE